MNLNDWVSNPAWKRVYSVKVIKGASLPYDPANDIDPKDWMGLKKYLPDLGSSDPRGYWVRRLLNASSSALKIDFNYQWAASIAAELRELEFVKEDPPGNYPKLISKTGVNPAIEGWKIQGTGKVELIYTDKSGAKAVTLKMVFEGTQAHPKYEGQTVGAYWCWEY